MFPRRFSITLALLSIFVATAATPALPQTAQAWLYGFNTYDWHTGLPWQMGIASRTGTPSSTVFGHLPQPGTIGEIAVLQAVLKVGDQVPLPHYLDASLATDDELFWTAQLWHANFAASGIVRYMGGDNVVATFSGRQLVSATGQIDGGGPAAGPATDVQVLVNVVAIRSHGTVPTRRQSLGSVKARYR